MSGFDPLSAGLGALGDIFGAFSASSSQKKQRKFEEKMADKQIAAQEAMQQAGYSQEDKNKDARREWAVKLMQALQPSAGFDSSFADMLPGLGAALKGQLGAKGNQLFGTGTAAKFDFSKLLSALAKHNPHINASKLPINNLMLGGNPPVTTPPLNATPAGSANPPFNVPSHYDELIRKYGGGFNSGGQGGGLGGMIY